MPIEEFIGIACILIGLGLILLAFSRAGGREGDPFEFE